MAKIINLVELQLKRRGPAKKRPKAAKVREHLKWSAVMTRTLSIPLAAELMRTQETLPPLQGQSCILESGVLAFHREAHGAMHVLLTTESAQRTGVSRRVECPRI